MTIPKGTTQEQWDQYNADLAAFNKRMQEIKPKPENFQTNDEYQKAFSEWQMACGCDGPNYPGYYRAAND